MILFFVSRWQEPLQREQPSCIVNSASNGNRDGWKHLALKPIFMFLFTFLYKCNPLYSRLSRLTHLLISACKEHNSKRLKKLPPFPGEPWIQRNNKRVCFTIPPLVRSYKRPSNCNLLVNVRGYYMAGISIPLHCEVVKRQVLIKHQNFIQFIRLLVAWGTHLNELMTESFQDMRSGGESVTCRPPIHPALCWKRREETNFLKLHFLSVD